MRGPSAFQVMADLVISSSSFASCEWWISSTPTLPANSAIKIDGFRAPIFDFYVARRCKLLFDHAFHLGLPF